jgi:hypothetical protein
MVNIMNNDSDQMKRNITDASDRNTALLTVNLNIIREDVRELQIFQQRLSDQIDSLREHINTVHMSQLKSHMSTNFATKPELEAYIKSIDTLRENNWKTTNLAIRAAGVLIWIFGAIGAWSGVKFIYKFFGGG